MANRQFENVTDQIYSYMGTTVANQNLILEEIEKRLNSGMLATILLRTFLSSRLVFKSLKTKNIQDSFCLWCKN
jgi:hypothetical protein